MPALRLLALLWLPELPAPYAHVTTHSAAAPTSYTITDLGTLPGGTISNALGLNDKGQVVGDSITAAGRPRAFLWNPTGGMTDLGTLGGTDSSAHGVNDSGQVVGQSYSASGTWHAFLWTAQGGMIDLGAGDAHGINDSGAVVGQDGAEHPFIRTASGGITALGADLASGINNRGQVVGRASTGMFSSSAFLWTATGGMTKLGTLPGYANSEAWAVNDVGQVAGDAFDAQTAKSWRAFLWTQSGGMTDLGTLGGSYSRPYAINNSGEVVGQVGTPSTAYAFLWTAKGGMIDLNRLLPTGSGWELIDATGINAQGQIVGGGSHNGQQHAFLLTPNSTKSVSVQPGGQWISPDNNFVVNGEQLRLAAHAYPTHKGDPAVDHVDFTAAWPQGKRKQVSWHTICSLTHPRQSDVYECGWSLLKSNVPIGSLTVSFDVYDKAGNYNLAPHGFRRQGVAHYTSLRQQDEKELQDLNDAMRTVGLAATDRIRVTRPIAGVIDKIFVPLDFVTTAFDLKKAVIAFQEEPKHKAALEQVRTKYGKKSQQYRDALSEFQNWFYDSLPGWMRGFVGFLWPKLAE